MKNPEKTWVPSSEPEESGVRHKSLMEEGDKKLKKVIGLSDADISRRLAEKAEEEHPDNPWEDVAPVAEADTAKVWGVEDLHASDKEDATYDRKLADQLRRTIGESEVGDIPVMPSKRKKTG